MTRYSKSLCRPPCRQHSQSGFTLIELAIVLVIIGIIAAIAAPDYQRWKHSRSLQQAARSVYSAMQQARLGAVKTGTTWAVWFDTANNRFYVFSDPGFTANPIPTVPEWQSVGDNLDAKGQNPPRPIYIAGKNLDTDYDGVVDLLDASNIRYPNKAEIEDGRTLFKSNNPLDINTPILFYPNGTASVSPGYIYLDHCPDPANPGSNANIDACGGKTAPVYAIGAFNTGFPVIRKWDVGAGGWR